MLKHLTLSLALALPLLASAADPTYVDLQQRLSAEQLHATGLDTLKPAQIELLNRLLREDAVKTEAATVASTKAALAADTSHTERHHDGATHVGLDEGPVSSRVKGTVSGWEPGTVFELENGQQWKVLRGSATLRKPLTAPEIQVIPGVAGRWFLQVDEDMPKARVYRID